MTATAPDRSLDQRMRSLQLATEVRMYRAQLKADVRTGTRSFLAVLAVPPSECETMKVRDLLVAIPGVGRVKADKVLWRAGAAPSKTFAGLTDRQRLTIASALRENGRNP